MRVRQVTMTPELAAKLLERNLKNRITAPYRVAALAKAMQEDRFYPEAAGPVVVGSDKLLHDGQHRLYATVESGVSWPCILIEDAMPAARMAYDTGKRRSFADWLRMNDITQETLVASVTRLLWFWDNGHMASRAAWMKARAVLQPDHTQLWEFYQANQERIHAGMRLGRQAEKSMLRSVAVLGAIVLMDIDEDECSDFYRQLRRDGETSEQVNLLLKRLDSLPSLASHSNGQDAFKGDQQYQLALLIKTWNYWISGEVPADGRALKWVMGGKKPEPMPVPRAA